MKETILTPRQFRDVVTGYRLPGQTDLDVAFELLANGLCMKAPVEQPQRFDVVEFHRDVALLSVFTNETRERAAQITHMLTVGMHPDKRARGYHWEMKPHMEPAPKDGRAVDSAGIM